MSLHTRRSPSFSRVENGVGNEQEPSCTGNQGYFLGFSGDEKALVHGAQDRIVPSPHEGALVHCCADRRAATPDMALPTMFAAISVMGSQTSQGCNLTPRQRSELGQFCDESSSNDFANAR